MHCWGRWLREEEGEGGKGGGGRGWVGKGGSLKGGSGKRWRLLRLGMDVEEGEGKRMREGGRGG